MNNVSRVFATGFIWAALTILGVAMMVSHADISGGTLAFVMTVLIIGATVGTLGIWQSNSHQADVKLESEKAKRRSRVERLMSDLDDRDIEELRSRLMLQEDEEGIPLEELMRTSNRR
jgi:hypothetical protein